MLYAQIYDDEWVAPVRRGYRTKCCKCGLVHVVDYRLVKVAGGKQIQFRARRVGKA